MQDKGQVSKIVEDDSSVSSESDSGNEIDLAVILDKRRGSTDSVKSKELEKLRNLSTKSIDTCPGGSSTKLV